MPTKAKPECLMMLKFNLGIVRTKKDDLDKCIYINTLKNPYDGWKKTMENIPTFDLSDS